MAVTVVQLVAATAATQSERTLVSHRNVHGRSRVIFLSTRPNPPNNKCGLSVLRCQELVQPVANPLNGGGSSAAAPPRLRSAGGPPSSKRPRGATARRSDGRPPRPDSDHRRRGGPCRGRPAAVLNGWPGAQRCTQGA